MKTCIYCGEENEDDDAVCFECGRSEFENLKNASLGDGESEEEELDEEDQYLDDFYPDPMLRDRLHYLFAHVFLPTHVHQSPHAFFSYLYSPKVPGGPWSPTRFIQSRWDLFEKSLGLVSDSDDSERLAHQVSDLSMSIQELEGHPVALVVMPTDEEIPEAFYVGMVLLASVTHPESWPRDAQARVFTLERVVENEELHLEDDSGVLCEWTKDGEHRNFGIRVGVDRQEFLQRIAILLGAPELSAPATFVPGKKGKSPAILLAAETASPEATGYQITPHSYEVLQGGTPPRALGRGPRMRCDSGELAEAELIHHEALVLSRHGGDEYPGVVAWLHNLAGVLQAHGKLEPAEMICAEALALCRKLWGVDHPLVATALQRLTTVVQAREKLEEAERLHREALAPCQKLPGADRPGVASSLPKSADGVPARKKLKRADPLQHEPPGREPAQPKATRTCPDCGAQLQRLIFGKFCPRCDLGQESLSPNEMHLLAQARRHQDVIFRRNLGWLLLAIGLYALMVFGLYVFWHYQSVLMTPFLWKSLFAIFGIGGLGILGLYLFQCSREALLETRQQARRRERGARPRYDPKRIYAEARACARNALLSGCPAYFFSSGMGWFIWQLDDEFGLPEMLQGDWIGGMDEVEHSGHNQGIRETIKEYGLPWNSRKPWLKEIRNPEEYFLQQAEKIPPLLLRISGAPATSSDGSTVISFESEVIPDCSEFVHLSLKVTSSKLWCGKSFRCVNDYKEFKSPPDMAGATVKTLPRLQLPKPASKGISPIPFEHWDRHKDAKVELVFGPARSELAFIRFHEFKPRLKEIAEVYGVLDLQLVEWIGEKYNKPTNRF